MVWKKNTRRKKPSVAAAKLFRCLQLIHLLGSHRMTVDEVSERMDISQRTVYRYIHLFDEAGYSVDRDFDGKFFIFDEPAF
jgi:DNA-binding IclR family transcriptional regulator